jgi:hypothetical protein
MVEISETTLTIIIAILTIPFWWDFIYDKWEEYKRKKDIKYALKEIIKQMKDYTHESAIVIKMQFAYIGREWLYRHLGIIIDERSSGDFIDHSYRLSFPNNFFYIDFRGILEYGRVNGLTWTEIWDKKKPVEKELKQETFFSDFGEELKKLCIKKGVFKKEKKKKKEKILTIS